MLKKGLAQEHRAQEGTWCAATWVGMMVTAGRAPKVSISKRDQTLGKVQSWYRSSVIVSHIYHDDSKAGISKACGPVDC